MAKRTRKRTTEQVFKFTRAQFRGEISIGGITFAPDGEWWVCYYGWKGSTELSRVKLKYVQQTMRSSTLSCS
jgi:hypothetical protein